MTTAGLLRHAVHSRRQPQGGAIEQFHQAEEKGRDPGQRTLALLTLFRRFLDVCNAIDYAHSRGVLHRDLKPANIMLGKFGETLVVDWGLAKSVGRPEAAPKLATMDDRTLVPRSASDLRGTELGARLGTPAYMSPEQAAGRIDFCRTRPATSTSQRDTLLPAHGPCSL